uniref:breast carcinoma-amplified sequence 1 n=1 Tax=Lonchura striata TaxID=40157 RepID=UPI00129415E5|nr:breast carcinoma-amplified sequence 1 [Lonchura striata domestica]
MGNNLSVPEEAEDDNTCTVKSFQPLPESPESITNGSVVFVQTPPLAVNGEAVAAVPLAEPGPGARAGGQSGGSAASRAQPAARLRSPPFFPWAVPGRAEEPAVPPAPREAALGATRLNGAPSEGTEAPHQGTLEGTRAKLGQDAELAGTPEGHDVAAPKGRQVTLLDRIFRLEKGKGRTQSDPQEGRQSLDDPDGSIAAGAPNGVLLGKELDECRQKELGQDSAGDRSPAAAAAGRAQVEQGSAQAAAGQGSVMSFLRTLVSSSKAEAKSDSEDKGSRAEKGPGGQPGPKAAAGSPSKGAKKKKAESPKKLGHSTFSKLFRHKAEKETQQTANTKLLRAGVRRLLPLCLAPQNCSEEAEAAGREKAEAAPEAAAPARDESESAESAGAKPRAAESRTPKANLRKFFKLTLNATEKPLAPPESDPGGPRSKEGSKDKKSTLELGKQKGKEQPEPREQPAPEPDSIHNGGDSKEPSYKKTEKRQSLGGFFKGLGSKRMSDAEVQTDPVSILPAGKSK